VKADESKTLKKKAFFQSGKVKVDELIGLFVNQACFLFLSGFRQESFTVLAASWL
jgi:hypothetical protein